MSSTTFLMDQPSMSMEAFKVFLFNNSDIVTMVNAQGSILFHSHSHKQKMSYHENELKGKFLLDMVHPDDLPHVSLAFAEALGKPGLTDTIVFRLRNKDGSYLPIEAFGNNQLHNPEIKALIIHSKDVTPLLKAIEEKNQLIGELSKINCNLENYHFISTHNIRGPLTNLLAISSLLEPGKVIDEELLKGLQASTEQLNQTLYDFIMGMKQAKIDPLPSDTIALDSFFKEQVLRLSEELKKINASVKIEVEEGFQLHFPAHILTYVIHILLKNAIHYREPSRQLEIKLHAFENERKCFIEVTDNGTGLELSRIKNRLFGFYQRFHKNSTGKGLSLFMAKTKLEALGCTLQARSEPDRGSTFSIAIPIYN